MCHVVVFIHQTPKGKSRAWVRLVLNANMAEVSLQFLLLKSYLLTKHYEEYALMRCAEGSNILVLFWGLSSFFSFLVEVTHSFSLHGVFFAVFFAGGNAHCIRESLVGVQLRCQRR